MSACEAAVAQNRPPKPRTTWSERETWTLITLWEEHLGSLRAEKRNAKVYEAIVQGLARSGIIKSRKQVQAKIDNLTQAYRNCAKQRTTGSAPVSWIYFSEIHRFLGSLPANDHSLVEESATVEQLISSMETGMSPSTTTEGPSATTDEWEEPLTLQDTSFASVSEDAENERPRQNSQRQRARKRKAEYSDYQKELLEEQRQLRKALETATEKEVQLMERQVRSQEKLVDLMASFFNKA